MRLSACFALLRLALLCCTITACASALPSMVQTTESRWKNFDEAREAFTRIQPGVTTIQDLWAMGFNPFKQPNIRLLNYLDVTRIFLPNESIRLSDLPPSLQACLKTQTSCQGYEVVLGTTQRDRHGNVLLDIFNFQRNTRISGWQFRGLIVLQNDTVAYKLDSGQPSTLEHENKKNPLGPLQEISVPLPR